LKKRTKVDSGKTLTSFSHVGFWGRPRERFSRNDLHFIGGAMQPVGEVLLYNDPERAELDRGSILFIGTATVIIRYAGFTILTDPNFLHAGDHVHLGYGLKSKRLTDPAIDIEQLPPVDLCVLSHYHGDHFDRVAEENLHPELPIITTSHAAKKLRKKEFKQAISLDTWQASVFRKGPISLRITSMPGKHGPGISQAFLPPVMGSMLEFLNRSQQILLAIYISGDTIFHPSLYEIPKRHPKIDLGLFHLGGTRVLGLPVSMDDQQGLKAVQVIEPDVIIPIHYNDYTVFKSPREDFKRTMQKAGIGSKVQYLAHGDTYHFEISSGRIRADEVTTIASGI
jgi:L-ascorbate metabolism protein UlaG (beta-lactamase superfamily)